MNNEEKMLIKQENKSIFEKAFEFIKKLFSTKKEETNFKSNTSHKKNNSFTVTSRIFEHNTCNKVNSLNFSEVT